MNIKAVIDKAHDRVVAHTDTTGKPVDLPYDDFAKLDIRVGIVSSAEAVPKSKKLLKLQVDFGPSVGTRTILAGIAGSYLPDNVVNSRVVAVLNLAPRTMMGEVSHGMLLASRDDNGNVWLLAPGHVSAGAEVG
jgi:methionyl-tRNA synthetase